MRILGPITALAALALACSSTPEKKAEPEPVRTVADADLGRLSPDQMAPVNAARARHDEARDAAARAELRLQQSRQEEGWANADKAAAESDRLRATAELRAATEAGDQRRIAMVKDRLDAAALRAKAADARLDYARKLVAAREAELRTAEARARRVEWELEHAKLATLRAEGVPAASKYDSAPIERMIAEAAKAEDAARARSNELGGTARAAYDSWRSLNEQYEARARSTPAG